MAKLNADGGRVNNELVFAPIIANVVSFAGWTNKRENETECDL
jgi:hypothetical protein